MTKEVKNTHHWPMHIDEDKSQDLFMQRDGYDFAGCIYFWIAGKRLI